MANLVKIKEVYLYVALTEHAQECYEIKKLLDDNNIPHQILAYIDPSQHSGVADSLSTWTFKNGQRAREDFRFPIVHWKNLYDDFESDLDIAIGLTEFTASALLSASVPVV